MADKAKQDRVLQELKSVGVANITTARMEAKKLHELLHDDEHIMGAIRGRYNGDGAMFVATNERMLLLNYKPLFNTNDEISYMVLAGVSYNPQGPFAGVVIHTRMGDFNFTFVRKESAKTLVDYLEQKHIDASAVPSQTASLKPVKDAAIMSDETRIFLVSHNLGVLSTLNPDGGINGAVVYYVLDGDGLIYIVTRWATNKVQNIKRNSEVAFTVYDEPLRTTVQLRGFAVIETRPKQADAIIQKVVKPHLYNKEIAWPPLTKLTAGPYQVLQISPTEVKYRNFS